MVLHHNQPCLHNDIQNCLHQLHRLRNCLHRLQNCLHRLRNCLHRLRNCLHRLLNCLHWLQNCLHRLQNCLHRLRNCLHRLRNCLHRLQNCLHRLRNCLHRLQNCLHRLQNCSLADEDLCDRKVVLSFTAASESSVYLQFIVTSTFHREHGTHLEDPSVNIPTQQDTVCFCIGVTVGLALVIINWESLYH